MSTFGKIGARDLVWKPPYDAEVEWLSNGGTGYVTTGIYARAGIGVEFSYMGAQQWVSAYPIGWGNDWSGMSQKYTFDMVFGDQFRRIDLGIGLGRISTTRYSTLGNTSWTKFCTMKIDTHSGVLSYNGNTLATGLSLPLPSPAPYPNLAVFARYHSNENTAPQISSNYFHIGYFKISIDGVVVRDFIPVRVGSGDEAVGFLYDRANITGGPFGNGLYGNSANGNKGFASSCIGPDKVVGGG